MSENLSVKKTTNQNKQLTFDEKLTNSLPQKGGAMENYVRVVSSLVETFGMIFYAPVRPPMADKTGKLAKESIATSFVLSLWGGVKGKTVKSVMNVCSATFGKELSQKMVPKCVIEGELLAVHNINSVTDWNVWAKTAMENFYENNKISGVTVTDQNGENVFSVIPIHASEACIVARLSNTKITIALLDINRNHSN